MEDKYEGIVLDNISKFGWHAALVLNDAPAAFAYSVGLQESLDHPEFILFGLKPETMHSILQCAVGEVRSGRRFESRGLYEDLVQGYAIECRPVDESWHTRYLGYAMWHRRHVGETGSLQAVQIVWPDKAGLFPWEPGCHVSARTLQPRLDLRQPPEAS
jgi:hypothetical protein